jgi:integrase
MIDHGADNWNEGFIRACSGGARKVFEKRCINAGVPYFHPHSFRHLIVATMSKTRLTEEEKKGLDFNLTPEWVDQAFVEAKKKYPKLTLRQRGESGFWTGDIDRIDSSKGYTIDNCRI